MLATRAFSRKFKMYPEEIQDNRVTLNQIKRYSKVGLIYLPKPARYGENRAFFGRVMKPAKQGDYKQFHLEGFELYLQDECILPERELISGTLLVPKFGQSQFVLATKNGSHEEIKIVRVCPYENKFHQAMLEVYPNQRIYPINLEQELKELILDAKKDKRNQSA